ncbi:MAG: PAS domain-containing protein [Myxococcota bacterium]
MDVVIGIDAKLRIVAWTADGMLGWGASAVLGRDVTEVIPPEDREVERTRLIGLLAGAAPKPGRVHRLHVDGHRVVRWAVPTPVHDGAGRVVALMEVLEREPVTVPIPEPTEETSRELIEIADALPQLVWTTDAEGRCDWVSRRWLEYTGVPEAEQLGSGWLVAVHPDDREPLLAAWSEARAVGAALALELRLRRHDGQYRWFDTRAAPLRASDGRVERWFGSNTDVTEQREVRQALFAEQERLARLAATVPGALITVRTDGAHTSIPWASPRVAELFGATPEQLGADAAAAWSRVHPEDRAQMTGPTGELDLRSAEFRVDHPTRGEVWVESHAAGVADPEGTTWYGILIDATRRKRAELELHSSRASLLAALAAGDMGTWTIDPERRLAWFDGRTASILGLEPFHPTPVAIAEVVEQVLPEDRPALVEAMRRMRAKPVELQARIGLPGGPVRWITVRGGPEPTAGRAQLSGVVLDVSERRRLEDSQLRSQKLEALGTLAGGIAHDFNNIVYAIAGNTRLAAADLPANHPAHLELREIAKATARATDLVRRILAFSRPDEARYEIRKLGPVVDEAVRLLHRTVPATVELQYRGSTAPTYARVDPSQVHQIVVNLVTNSVHAIGSRRGKIELELEPVDVSAEEAAATPGLNPGAYARLTVRDDGAGMDEGTLQRVFDPFFTTKAPNEGTGLGLSVVHGIVLRHGGAVALTSSLGSGTTFRLWFPAVAPVVPEAVTPVPPEMQTPPHELHVLYVDDDPSLVSLATRILSRAGYRVSGFTRPAEALERFRADPTSFDLVVTDLLMPNLSGIDLARALLAIRPKLPILLTSGYVAQRDREEALAVGVHDLVIKPNTLDRLTRLLEELARTVR